ncbi:hypothetical protein QZH41_002271 [Actinostola sp. cb2023]|nr:hypothetical protein QZH41_002271 [Actinostola sp. cb2023]
MRAPTVRPGWSLSSQNREINERLLTLLSTSNNEDSTDKAKKDRLPLKLTESVRAVYKEMEDTAANENDGVKLWDFEQSCNKDPFQDKNKTNKTYLKSQRSRSRMNTESVIQKLQREMKELKDSANITLVDNAIASLQQLIAHPAGLFDPYAVLAALEQVVNVAQDKNDARSGRFNVILRQCRPLISPVQRCDRY